MRHPRPEGRSGRREPAPGGIRSGGQAGASERARASATASPARFDNTASLRWIRASASVKSLRRIRHGDVEAGLRLSRIATSLGQVLRAEVIIARFRSICITELPLFNDEGQQPGRRQDDAPHGGRRRPPQLNSVPPLRVR